jgi:hypothetical protein
MQSEVVAYAWMGIFAAAVVLGITLFVRAAFEWIRTHRPRRQKREKWPNR